MEMIIKSEICVKEEPMQEVEENDPLQTPEKVTVS